MGLRLLLHFAPDPPIQASNSSAETLQFVSCLQHLHILVHPKWQLKTLLHEEVSPEDTSAFSFRLLNATILKNIHLCKLFS